MKKLVISLIHFYQRNISSRTPPACRFIPTCSSYAVQAIERFGIFHGGALAVWRILRCNPLGRPGYDPVPERKPKPLRKCVKADKHSGKDN